MFIGTLKGSKALSVVFLPLQSCSLLAAGNYLGSESILVIAGYEGILTGLSAIYAALGQVLNEAYGKKIVPSKNICRFLHVYSGLFSPNFSLIFFSPSSFHLLSSSTSHLFFIVYFSSILYRLLFIYSSSSFCYFLFSIFLQSFSPTIILKEDSLHTCAGFFNKLLIFNTHLTFYITCGQTRKKPTRMKNGSQNRLE